MEGVIAATGHRPDKLGGDTQEVKKRLLHIAKRYLREKNPREVITGMALGWDTAVALAAIQLHIPFVAAIPFAGQDAKWSTEQRRLYRLILTHASDVTIVCEPGYNVVKYQRRNEWMADRCARVMALWDGSPGGTANMIRYAGGPGRWKMIDNLWDEWSTKYANLHDQSQRQGGS